MNLAKILLKPRRNANLLQEIHPSTKTESYNESDLRERQTYFFFLSNIVSFCWIWIVHVADQKWKSEKIQNVWLHMMLWTKRFMGMIWVFWGNIQIYDLYLKWNTNQLKHAIVSRYSYWICSKRNHSCNSCAELRTSLTTCALLHLLYGKVKYHLCNIILVLEEKHTVSTLVLSARNVTGSWKPHVLL